MIWASMSKSVYFPFRCSLDFENQSFIFVILFFFVFMLHKCSFSKFVSLHLYFSGMSRSGELQMLHNGTFAGINRDGERGPSYFSSSFFLYCLLTRTGDSMRILDTLCCNVEYWVLANNQKPNITCEVLGRFPRI